MHIGFCIEPNITEDSGQTPIVLTFQIDAIGIFEYVDGYGVFPRFQKVGNIVFGRFMRAFVVAHLFSVDPDKRCRSGSLHAQKDALALPACRQRKRFAIRAGRVVFTGNKWRIGAKRLWNVSEKRIAETLHLPIGGNCNIRPFAIIEVRCKKTVGGAFRSIGIMKFPLSIQRKHIFRLRFLLIQGFTDRFKRNTNGVTFSLVDFKHLCIFDERVNVSKCRLLRRGR